MADPIKLAVQHKHLHPSDSYKSVAEQFQVTKTTLYNHFKGTHQAAGINTPRALSIKQERVSVDKISSYAICGTVTGVRRPVGGPLLTSLG